MIVDLLTAIEMSLDRDLLLEREKADMYWAFDTKELTRGSIRERFSAYASALQNNIMQVDEVRELEDLPPTGFHYFRLGLQDVLLDQHTGLIYTPNTNAWAKMNQKALKNPEDSGTMEPRANPYHDEKGRFASAGAEKTKYAPSKQVNASAIKVSPKKYAALCGEFRTRYPDAKPSDGLLSFSDGRYLYKAIASENGGISIRKRIKLG